MPALLAVGFVEVTSRALPSVEVGSGENVQQSGAVGASAHAGTGTSEGTPCASKVWLTTVQLGWMPLVGLPSVSTLRFGTQGPPSTLPISWAMSCRAGENEGAQ